MPWVVQQLNLMGSSMNLRLQLSQHSPGAVLCVALVLRQFVHMLQGADVVAVKHPAPVLIGAGVPQLLHGISVSFQQICYAAVCRGAGSCSWSCNMSTGSVFEGADVVAVANRPIPAENLKPCYLLWQPCKSEAPVCRHCAEASM